jgi:hypothetical protein
MSSQIEDACMVPASVGETKTADKSEHDQTKSPAGTSQLGGMLWFAGWLFTIGFAQLVWWKALLGVIAWPYFLGMALRL